MPPATGVALDVTAVGGAGVEGRGVGCTGVGVGVGEAGGAELVVGVGPVLAL